MARKVGQIIARGDPTWLIRVYLGCDRETKKRNYHMEHGLHVGYLRSRSSTDAG